MSLAKYRKIFKNGHEVNYPIPKVKDQNNGNKEKTDNIPKKN